MELDEQIYHLTEGLRATKDALIAIDKRLDILEDEVFSDEELYPEDAQILQLRPDGE